MVWTPQNVINLIEASAWPLIVLIGIVFFGRSINIALRHIRSIKLGKYAEIVVENIEPTIENAKNVNLQLDDKLSDDIATNIANQIAEYQARQAK